MPFSISKMRPSGHNHAYKYAHAQKTADFSAINSRYKEDLDENKCWNHPVPQLKDGTQLFYGNQTIRGWNADCPELKDANYMFRQSSLNSWKGALPKLESAYCTYMWSGITSWDTELPSLKKGIQMFQFQNLSKFETSLPNLEEAANFNAANYNGNVNLGTTWSIPLPKLKNAYAFLSGYRLDKKSIIDLLNSIPTYNDGAKHEIGLGLGRDNYFDPDVNLALKTLDNNYQSNITLPEITEDRGWTLAYEWRGPITIDEYTPNNVREKIYADEVTLPNGYTRCEYLQSTSGLQYFNTDYIPNTEETGIYVFAKMMSGCPIGASVRYLKYFTVEATRFGHPITGNIGYTWPSVHHPYTFTEVYLNWKKSKSTILNLVAYDTISMNHTTWGETESYPTLPISCPLWIGGNNAANGQVEPIHSQFVGKIFRIKISEGDEIIRDYVPCLDADGVPVMYDVINGITLYKQGTGEDFGYKLHEESLS